MVENRIVFSSWAEGRFPFADLSKKFFKTTPLGGLRPSQGKTKPSSSRHSERGEKEVEESVLLAGLPVRTGKSKRALPFSRLNEGSPERERFGIFPLWRVFASFLHGQKG